MGKTLGEGSFSQVVRGTRRPKNNSKNELCPSAVKNVAVKIIDRKSLATNMRERFLPREIEIIKIASHPNIIRFHFMLELRRNNLDRIFIITGKLLFCAIEKTF